MAALAGACAGPVPGNSASGNSAPVREAPPAATRSEAEPFATVGVEDFEKMLRQTGVVILDVRTAEEYAQGHLLGAKNIDVNAENFAQKIAALDKRATYLVYCRSGARSARACDQMTALGFSKLYNLEGGMRTWDAAGKPVEK
jgi:rhodanese-related sulfurtransferase